MPPRESTTVDSRLEVARPVAVVAVTGHLGLADATGVRHTLHKALAGHPDAVVIDLTGLIVVERVALIVFVSFARYASAWAGCPVAICGASRHVHLQFDRMALGRDATLHPDRERALAAVGDLPPPCRYRRLLGPVRAAPRRARAMVAAACQTWHLPHLLDRAQLVVTELVTNAFLHARTEMEVAVALRHRHLHLSVRDRSRELPQVRSPDPSSGAGGRGLVLVAALASGWGAVPTPEGKVVWATLTTDRPTSG